MSSGLMVFYPKTHQIPWGYLNSFLSVPRKEARAEAGILLTTRSSSLKKKGIWYVVLELHFVTRLGLTSTLIVCTGPWHLKGRKRCHCCVLYCSLHSACNTVHKKCPRWKNKNKIVKNGKISTHILQEKENGKTCLVQTIALLLELTAIGILTNDLVLKRKARNFWANSSRFI